MREERSSAEGYERSRLALRSQCLFPALAVALSLFVFAVAPARAAEPEYAKPISSRLNTTGRTVAVPVPLKDGTAELGDVTVQIESDDTVLVSKSELGERLQRVLDTAARARLAGVPEQGGFASLPALTAAGIAVRFDPGLQELHLALSTDSRSESDISFASQPARPSSSLAQPALFSGYINVITGIDHLWGTTPGSAGGSSIEDRTSGRLELDSAVRLRDTVFENRAMYEGEVDANVCPTGAHCIYGHEPGLKRQSSRLVYDMPERLVRLEIGDTEAISSPIQRSVETLGISLEKSARKLAPGQTPAVAVRTTLRIDRPSDVDVIVNGAVLQRLHLRPGVYNLRDLPLATGANEIQLAVTDDAGARRTETFTTFAGNDQLAAGQSEWGVTAGVPSYLRDNDRVYDLSGNYITTGTFRYGVSDDLTAMAHLQADDRTVMGGAGGVTQTPWGVFGIEVALSSGSDGNGVAANISYDLLNFSGLLAERKESLRLAAEYRSRDFHRPGDFLTTATGILYPEFNYWLRMSGTYSVALDWSVSATLSARYQFADDSQPALSPYTIKGDRYGTDLTLSRPLGPLASASLLVGYSNEAYLRDSFDMQGRDKADFRAALRFNMRPDDRTTISASFDTLDRQASVSGYRSQGEGIGRWDTSVDVQQFGYSDTATASGSIGYYGNRAEVRLSHNSDVRDIGFSSFDPQPSVQRTSLRVGSSIAFADGVVAVGPPIRGSAFAIVYPHESIAGKDVIIGEAEKPRAKADGWGAAVVTDVPAYSLASLGVDVADLPIGYSLGAGVFDLQAGYRQGYALEVGSSYSVSVYGTLLQASDEPLALTSGTAYPAGKTSKRVSLFTNASGRFGAEGLAPGRWIIEMAVGSEPLRFVVDVPKGTEGLFKAGNLKPVEPNQP